MLFYIFKYLILLPIIFFYNILYLYYFINIEKIKIKYEKYI